MRDIKWMRGSLYKIRPVCIKKDHAWQLPKWPRVGTSEAAMRGTLLAVCHAVNLAWATVHYCVANAFVMRGTTQKMPRMCEVISGLYCITKNSLSLSYFSVMFTPVCLSGKEAELCDLVWQNQSNHLFGDDSFKYSVHVLELANGRSNMYVRTSTNSLPKNHHCTRSKQPCFLPFSIVVT